MQGVSAFRVPIPVRTQGGQGQPFKTTPRLSQPTSPVRFGFIQSIPTWAVWASAIVGTAGGGVWLVSEIGRQKATLQFNRLWNNAQTDDQKFALIRDTLKGHETGFQQNMAAVAAQHIAKLNDPFGIRRLRLLLEGNEHIRPREARRTERPIFEMQWNLYYMTQVKEQIHESFKRSGLNDYFYRESDSDLPLDRIVLQYLTSLAMLDQINDKNRSVEKAYGNSYDKPPADPHKSTYQPLYQQFTQSRDALKTYLDRLLKIEKEQSSGSVVPALLGKGISRGTAAEAERLIKEARTGSGG